MRLLLDTHALIWAVDDPSRVGAGAIAALEEPANELTLSTGSMWELAIKCSLGKLSLSLPYREWLTNALADLGAKLLPITLELADAHTRLPNHHRDPFDRLLVAQASVENMTLVSGDTAFDQYGITRLW